MRSFGNIDLEQGKLVSPAMFQEAELPSEGFQKGRLSFTGNALYICVEVGDAPVWVPLTNTIKSYVEKISSEQTTITVTHSLDSESVIVAVFTENNEYFIPDNIKIDSISTVTVTLEQGVDGKVVVISGSSKGSGVLSSYFINVEKEIPEEVWTINHGLGYYPLVTTIIEGVTILPEYVKHNDTSSLEIGWSSPTAGLVRLI